MAYCERCDRSFNSFAALSQHQDDSSKHNICQQCNKDFTTGRGLIQHCVQSPRHYYCEACDELFDDDDELDDHYEDDHYYCSSCERLFDSEHGLHEHNRQRHWYCVSCKRLFQSESNLNHHLQSSIHQPRQLKCLGCRSTFISQAGLILHCESGGCPSGVTRQAINRLVKSIDTSNIITNPNRLIRGSDATVIASWATGSSWNGDAYECVLCHKEFRSLSALNAHLQSPAHESKIYRCPIGWQGCNTQFRTLSSLVQHVESGFCGVKHFRNQIEDVLGSVTDKMRRLAF